MDDPLLERLRNALAPRYTVERLLGRGGMGAVYLGYDTKLKRSVAIKFIRPELASAPAVENFVREARILARVSHPNIVPVHDADEADGLPYYTMDYLQGETLDDRLVRGRMTWRDALKLGRDVLDGLEAAHSRGVVHRDIKPANIFLQAKRAVLVDFGIAKSVTNPDAASTAPGRVPGTYGWMAPEHQLGGDVTRQSDLYVVAMVVYEALTSRHWPAERLEEPEQQDWRGVPRRIARVLRRALQLRSDRRWPDAESFRQALWRCRVWPYRLRTAALALGGIVLGAAVGLRYRPAPPAPAARVQVEAFTPRGGPPEPGLGDSVARALARRLSHYPDLAVRGPGDPSWGWRRGATQIVGTVTHDGDILRIEATAAAGGLVVRRSGPRAQAPALADSLADDLFAALLVGPGRELDVSLPAAVRPTTRDGRIAFLEAERLFAQARWSEAFAGYRAAAAADTACWICVWRHDEVGRWLGLVHDTTDLRRIRAHVGAFPPHYQSMIRAEMLPVRARLDTLDALTRRWPEFVFGQFRRADELLHRGPLVGRRRREAVGPFDEVVRLRPDFAPAWEHLTWVHIAEGDTVDAARAFANYARTGAPGELLTEQFRALFRVASAWRFRAPEQARPVTADIVARAAASGMADIDAGARMLPHFDAPDGAIYFGRLLEARPAFERSGLVAQLFGQLTLGRPDAARAAGRTLLARFPDANLELFVNELDAVLLLFDTDPADRPAGWTRLRQALAERAAMRAGSADARRRAAWMLALASQRVRRGAGPPDDAGPYRGNLRGEPAPRPLTRLLAAVELAGRGQYARALEVSDSLVELQAGPSDDPFFRTVLHLLRAEWYAVRGERESARRELLWHENADLFRYLTGDPEAVEVDWAFGTLARWRRARLLDGAGARDDDACRAYRAVGRLWAQGEPVYAARADTARARAAIVCGAAP